MEATKRVPGARAAPSRGRLALARAAVGLAGVALVAGVSYLVARETSLFALQSVEVTGVPEELRAEVRHVLAPLEGESLVTIEPADAERRVEQVAAIVSARADRDFPHTLRLHATPERPVALVRYHDSAWVVSARGRVLREVGLGIEPGLPRIWLSGDVAPPDPGSFLLDDQGGELIRALARVPADFPTRVAAARRAPDGIVVVLRPARTELRLGDAGELRLKLAVAAAVLESLPAAERQALAYLDVSVPARPVSLEKSQVETSA